MRHTLTPIATLYLLFALLLGVGCDEDSTHGGSVDVHPSDVDLVETSSMPDSSATDTMSDSTSTDATSDSGPRDVSEDTVQADTTVAVDLRDGADGSTPPPLPIDQTWVLIPDGPDSTKYLDQIPFSVSGDGVLVIQVVSETSVDVTICMDESFCEPLTLRQSNQAPEWAPELFYMEFDGAQDGHIEIETRDYDRPSSRTIELQVRFLPWTDEPTTHQRLEDAVDIQLPIARRGQHPGDGISFWYHWDAPSAGYISIIRIAPIYSAASYLCDAELYRGNPLGCPDSRERLSHFFVTRAGAQYILLDSQDGSPQDYRFFAVFTPDPVAPLCASGEHANGAGACAPIGSCASGYHDGGWGDCVAEGVCDSGFLLDDAQRCAGWLHLTSLPEGRRLDRVNGTHTTLSDGRTYFGGHSIEVDEYRSLVFDPDTGSWLESDTTLSDHWTWKACPLGDGRALVLQVTGTSGLLGNPTVVERIYDPVADAWSELAAPSGVTWKWPDCLLLSDGTTLAYDPYSASRFDPASETWTSAGSGPLGSHEGTAVEAANGHVFVAAGAAEVENNLALWDWDPADNTWSKKADWPHSSELSDRAKLLTDGEELIVFCGEDSAQQPNRDAGRYTPADNTWTALQELPHSYLTNVIRSAGRMAAYTMESPRQIGFYDPTNDEWTFVGGAAPFVPLTLTQSSSGELFLIGQEQVVRYRVAP